MYLAEFAWRWTVESRPRQTLLRLRFPSKSRTSMIRSRPAAMFATAPSVSLGMPSLPMRSLPRPPAMMPREVSVSTRPAATERAHDPCAICGEAGGELLCVLRARASHEPRLETVCGKGLDERIDAFEHGASAGGGIEDHGHDRAIGGRVCGPRDAGVRVFGVA